VIAYVLNLKSSKKKSTVGSSNRRISSRSSGSEKRVSRISPI